MENVRLRQNPDGLYDDPIITRLIINKLLVEVMEIDSRVVHDMLFECLHRLGKCVQGKNHSIIVKFLLDEEMQIKWGKRRMLNGSLYDISSQFAPQILNARADIKSSLCS